MTDNWIWFVNGGGPQPLEEKGIAARSISQGAGWELVETARTYHSKFFALEGHLNRFAARCLEYGLEPPSAAVLAEAARAVSGKRAPLESRVDFFLQSRDSRLEGKPRTVWAVISSKLPAHVSAYYERGVRCDVVMGDPQTRLGRPPSSENFGEFSPQSGNSFERILTAPGGWLLGGESSRIFALIRRSLFTPEAVAGGRWDVTGEVVMELARGIGFTVSESRIKVSTLADAEEIFLASVLWEVVPVVEIGGRRVGRGEPGAIADGLLGAYQALCLKLTASQ